MVLEKDNEAPLRVETFPIKCFQYDLMAHRLVPAAKVLSADEEEAFLTAKRVAKTELSKILTVDPVAKYLGMRPGQIVRTERPALEGYFYYHWRVCAKGTVKK
jgi:DNA-directed RNA polymerase I, II, and III subunit RPABC1